MKRTVLAVLLASTVAFAPTASRASAITAGICQIGGQVYYSNPVVTIPDPTNYSVTGSLTCIENARADTGGASGLFGFTGFFQGAGSGDIGCAFSRGGGTFTLEYSTGTNKRDVWNGTFSNAGTALSLLEAAITRIDHQTWNGTSWATTSATTTSASLALGTFVFSVDDPLACGTTGFSIRDFIGNIGYSYAKA